MRVRVRVAIGVGAGVGVSVAHYHEGAARHEGSRLLRVTVRVMQGLSQV